MNYFISLDTDDDGIMEQIGTTGFRRVPAIFRNDFSHPVRLDYPITAEPWYMEVKRMGGDPCRIFIQQGNNFYFFSYGRNPFFLLRYPFYAGIYLGFLAIIVLSQFIQRMLLKQRYDAEKKITELQLMVLNNQIDPHVTFIAISTISAAILNPRPVAACRSG
ncbi:MAG: hypothetical protein ABIK52_05595, partial [Bacteroidota bacterium]